RLNPSEMFGRCMTERSYVECTASALGALSRLRAARPELTSVRLDRAIDRGVRFLRSTQRPDGSVPGFWGVNFTYGIFHFVEGLRAAGVGAGDPALVRAAAWLMVRQRADGGWGEHHSGARDERYVEHPESQPVMTAWALLAAGARRALVEAAEGRRHRLRREDARAHALGDALGRRRVHHASRLADDEPAGRGESSDAERVRDGMPLEAAHLRRPAQPPR